MENHYTNKEVDLIVNGITGRFDERLTDQDKTLARIETAVNKTNGYVAEIKTWKERTMGAMVVVLIVLLPILSWALIQVANFEDKIEEALSQYEIP